MQTNECLRRAKESYARMLCSIWAMIVHETQRVFFVCLVGWFFFLSIIIIGNTIDRF